MRVRGERHSSVGSTTPQSRRLARDALVGHRLLAGFGLDDDIRSRIDKAFVTIRPPHVIRRLAVVATHLENLRVPRRLANTVPRNFQMITWFGMHPFTSRLFWAWPINTPESLGFVGHKVPCDSGPASRRHPTSGEPQRRPGRPVASRGDFRPLVSIAADRPILAGKNRRLRGRTSDSLCVRSQGPSTAPSDLLV